MSLVVRLPKLFSSLVAMATLIAGPVALAQTVSVGTAPIVTKPATLSAVSASGSAAAKLSAVDVAAKIQKAYEGIATYEADFKQDYTMKAFGDKKSQSGHVTFMKPGKMRWEYNEPKENVVVSDGVTLWSYIAAEKSARKMLVKDSQTPAALSFLTGKGDLSKEFNLELVDPVVLKYEGGYVLKATPKVATSLYKYVLFYVEGTKFHVTRVLIVDDQDNRNKFDFTAAKVNLKYDDSKFTWTPPAGVTVTSN
jgi:outer membrane lipoprotein carrier protein